MNRFATAGLGLALAAAPLVATAATATANDATAQRASAPAYSVSAAINRTTAIAKEDVVKIRGAVSPKAAGDKVVLQQRLDGKKTWSVSGTATIKATGRFLLKDEPSTAGTRFYRVLKPAVGSVKKGVSPELKLVVYAWELLTTRPSGPETNMAFTTATIGTETFGASLVTEMAGANSSIEYTLGKKCLKLRATYALTDSSATGGSGTVALSKDGKNVFSYGLVLGQIIEDHEVDISDAFRISYFSTSTKAPDSLVAIGSPAVLCTK
ncbi:MAG: hypothetical protein JWN68_1167 [Nocardioides sp.]|jgi:hypothetical protein|uniref:hypothetical protein n=1 Tax=Nocardioides sp. TaxID=35761 RepID=UPI0026195402|nr:hypothetical protein [Nocardioides sp.]MCW2833214.1 hypothetical protein [Nocardioides sp.]